MDALLLAAGTGSRLGEHTRDRPKALVPVGGKSLIDYTLDRIEQLDWIERTVVVTGSGRDQVRDHLAARRNEKPTIEAYNAEFEKGNFYSLLVGLEAVGESWLLMNVDHVVPLALYEHCAGRAEGVSAVCDADRTLTDDCMKVRSGGSPPRVRRIHKGLDEWDHGYIGLTFVTPDGREEYLEAVREVRSSGDRDARAERVLQALADGGSGPRVIDASGFGWLEVDDPDDLRRAEERLRHDPGFVLRGRDRAGRKAAGRETRELESSTDRGTF